MTQPDPNHSPTTAVRRHAAHAHDEPYASYGARPGTRPGGGGWLLVRESDDQPLGVLRALGQRLAHLEEALPCCFGYLLPRFGEKRQTIPDKIVDSAVVKVR